MGNLLAAMIPLLHGLVKMAGLRQLTVELHPGTVINFWLPKHDNNNQKPAVVLVHGFAVPGITTWLPQILALTSHYSVYVPDLLFFGGSFTDGEGRSPEFQAECLTKCLDKLGVDECAVVGFSYGGMVAFKMAESRPDLVKSVVVTSGMTELTESVSRDLLARLGYRSLAEMLLPETPEGLRKLLRIGFYTKLWLPEFLVRDAFELMFDHRKERAELLEALVVPDKDAKLPNLQQRVLFLWGEDDAIFELELARNMSMQLGKKASLRGVEKAGHLVLMERTFAYNRCLKEFLAPVKNPHH